MAASGYTPIQLYRTATASAAPVAGNLTSGELAINYNAADMALYAKNGSGSVIRLMNNPAGLKYPTADGTNGQVLVTDGFGVLSWASAAAGFINGSGTTNYVPKFTSTSAIGNSIIYDDGTNVGIGTSTPSSQVSGTARVLQLQGVSGGLGSFKASDNAGTTTGEFYASVTGLVGISATSNSPLLFSTNNIECMRLDATGNLGLGVTPSAWSSIFKTIQTSGGVAFSGRTDIQQLNLSTNWYFDGANKYIANGYATRYAQESGGHYWSTAPSGTAGNTVSFYELMSASGTTAGSLLTLGRAFLTQGTGYAGVGGNSADSFILYSNSTERMRIDASGNVGIGTSSPAAKLDVRGGSTISTLAEWNTLANTVFELANPAVRFGIGYDSSDQVLLQSFDSINNVRNLCLQVYGGTVGIGTSLPLYALDVSAGGASFAVVDVARIYANASAAASARLLFGSAALNANSAIVGHTLTATDGMLEFQTRNSGGLNTRMTLDASGNLSSVGTYSNDQIQTFNIAVSTNYSPISVVGDKNIQSVGGVGIPLLLNSHDTASVRLSSTGVQFSTGMSERMRIDSTGNVGIGTSSPTAKLQVSGGNAIINGVDVGKGSSSGTNNTVLGASSFSNTTIGNGNVAIGDSTLSAVDIGNYNVAVGSQAMQGGEGSYRCIAIGFQANYNNYYDSDNISIGYRAGYLGLQNLANIAIGSNALYNNGTTSNNIAIGVNAIYNPSTAYENIGIGNSTINGGVGANNYRNLALGHSALESCSDGHDNCAIGMNSLPTLYDGVANVAVGANAGYKVTSGYNNTFIGYGSGNGTNGTTSGFNNTCIGYGSNTTAATVNNQFILGNSSVSALRCQVSLTVVSDARDKTNFQPLPSVLSLVDKLQPIKFDWNARDGGRVGSNDIGFTAQDLQQAQQDSGFTVPNLVNDDAPEKLGVTYSTLIPVLVKAIQEQQALINQLTDRITVLEGK